MQNLSRETALHKLPVSLRSTWISLHCWMLSCGSTTAMCLLVVMSGSLGTFGAMACWLVLFWILGQWLRLLVDTRIRRRVNDEIVHLLLGNITKQMWLLIHEIPRIRSRNCSLRNSSGCIPFFCRTRNTAAHPDWFCLGNIDGIRNVCRRIRCRGRLTHNDSTTYLWSSYNVTSWSVRGIRIHSSCIVDQDVVYIDPRWTNRARNAWSTSCSNRTLMLGWMLLLVFLHLSSCLVA